MTGWMHYPILRGPKMKRFAFIDKAKDTLGIERLCQTMGVTSRGYRAWKSRSISQRQRDDMVLLANIREQYALSLGTYGRPRMTVELQTLGFDVSKRRVGRLMRNNAIQAVRSKRYKRTTNSNHGLVIQPNVLDRDFTAQNPNEKWCEPYRVFRRVKTSKDTRHEDNKITTYLLRERGVRLFNEQRPS